MPEWMRRKSTNGLGGSLWRMGRRDEGIGEVRFFDPDAGLIICKS